MKGDLNPASYTRILVVLERLLQYIFVWPNGHEEYTITSTWWQETSTLHYVPEYKYTSIRKGTLVQLGVTKIPENPSPLIDDEDIT